MPSVLEDKDAIRDVLYRYCYGTDAGDVEAWVAGFTEDCLWDGGPFGLCNGKNAMREYFKQGADAAKSLRHLTLNTIIDVQGDRAQARSYIAIVGLTDASMSVVFSGFYADELVRKAGRWLIQIRRIVTDISKLKS